MFEQIKLLTPEMISHPEGLPTGLKALDEHLLWKGIPKGQLSSLGGRLGLGATSLWAQTAAAVSQKKKRVAWIEHDQSLLNPWNLKLQGVSLSQLFWVSKPKDLKQKLWVLQELCSLDAFEMIGCPLHKELPKDHQLLKLKRLAQKHKVAIVFLPQNPWPHPHLALSVHFQKTQLVILRASHRPAPHHIERRDLHANPLFEPVSDRKSLSG